jgi:hypothetical protein
MNMYRAWLESRVTRLAAALSADPDAPDPPLLALPPLARAGGQGPAPQPDRTVEVQRVPPAPAARHAAPAAPAAPGRGGRAPGRQAGAAARPRSVAERVAVLPGLTPDDVEARLRLFSKAKELQQLSGEAGVCVCVCVCVCVWGEGGEEGGGGGDWGTHLPGHGGVGGPAASGAAGGKGRSSPRPMCVRQLGGQLSRLSLHFGWVGLRPRRLSPAREAAGRAGCCGGPMHVPPPVPAGTRVSFLRLPLPRSSHAEADPGNS